MAYAIRLHFGATGRSNNMFLKAPRELSPAARVPPGEIRNFSNGHRIDPSITNSCSTRGYSGVVQLAWSRIVVFAPSKQPAARCDHAGWRIVALSGGQGSPMPPHSPTFITLASGAGARRVPAVKKDLLRESYVERFIRPRRSPLPQLQVALFSRRLTSISSVSLAGCAASSLFRPPFVVAN